MCIYVYIYRERESEREQERVHGILSGCSNLRTRRDVFQVLMRNRVPASKQRNNKVKG